MFSLSLMERDQPPKHEAITPPHPPHAKPKY